MLISLVAGDSEGAKGVKDHDIGTFGEFGVGERVCKELRCFRRRDNARKGSEYLTVLRVRKIIRNISCRVCEELSVVTVLLDSLDNSLSPLFILHRIYRSSYLFQEQG